VKRDEIFSALKSNLRAEITELRASTIQETDTPRDLGGHSLKVMEAITATKEQLGIRVSRDELLKTRNLGDVLDLFERASRR
jgi:acyl carrier protein